MIEQIIIWSIIVTFPYWLYAYFQLIKPRKRNKIYFYYLEYSDVIVTYDNKKWIYDESCSEWVDVTELPKLKMIRMDK